MPVVLPNCSLHPSLFLCPLLPLSCLARARTELLAYAALVGALTAIEKRYLSIVSPMFRTVRTLRAKLEPHLKSQKASAAFPATPALLASLEAAYLESEGLVGEAAAVLRRVVTPPSPEFAPPEEETKSADVASATKMLARLDSKLADGEWRPPEAPVFI